MLIKFYNLYIWVLVNSPLEKTSNNFEDIAMVRKKVWSLNRHYVNRDILSQDFIP